MTKDTIFEQHPSLEEYFKTSDGQAFYHEADAKLHARKLAKKAIEHVTRGCETKEVLMNSKPSNEDRESLIARYTELYQKAPAQNIGVKKLQERIAEKEAELNQNSK